MARKRPTGVPGSGGLLGRYLASRPEAIAERVRNPLGTIADALSQLYGYQDAGDFGGAVNQSVGGLLAGGGFKPMRPPEGLPAGFGAIGMMGGVKSRTADLGMLSIAREAEEKGLSNGKIRDATGWFRGADGRWQYEIPDQGMGFDASGLEQHMGPMSFGDAKDAVTGADDVFKAYPQLKNISVLHGPLAERYAGKYTGGPRPMLELNTNATGKSGGDASVAAHELTHAIQRIEGMAQGGSPSMFTDSLDPFGDYQRLMGEVQARNTQARLPYDMDYRRMLAPWDSADVPVEMQLRSADDGIASFAGLLGRYR